LPESVRRHSRQSFVLIQPGQRDGSGLPRSPEGVSRYPGLLSQFGWQLLVGIGPAQSGCRPGGESMKTSSQLVGWRDVGSLFAVAIFATMTGCSHESVSAAANIAPDTVVESAPDRNVVTLPNPERFAVIAAAARREADQIAANGVVAADVSRTYP